MFTHNIMMALFTPRYLGATLNGNSEDSDQILYKAIEATLVGNCFAFVFCVPSIVKNQTTLLSITEGFNERNTGAVERRRGLVVMTIKTICTGSDTMLSKLQRELEGTPQPTSCLPSLAVKSLPQKRSKSIDDSNFYDHTLPSESSPSQQFSRLLETYSESQESSPHEDVMATPISQSGFIQQCHTNYVSPSTLSLLLDTYSESPPPPKCECVSQRSQKTEVTTIDSGHKTEPLSIMINSKESTSHPQALSQVELQDYLSELSRTDWLVRELESDWESTQNKCSSPCTQQQCTFSLSKEMLRELQEPFSQSREGSPNCDTPISHSNTTSMYSSLSSQFCLQTQNSNSSPELFSSASSSYSRKTLIGADASQQSMQTPSQLMSDWRQSSSPELFESSSREEQDSGTATQLVQTPALSVRGRTHALRRKLVQRTETNVSMLASTHHTPCTLNQRNSTLAVNHNAFSPDIL